MTPKAGWYTPMLHVVELERSIPFYELLGFEVVDTDRYEPLGWARLHCQGAAMMLLRREVAIDPEALTVLFYMYTPDLAAFRQHLLANGVKVSEIQYPEHAPSGEVHLSDPDGYRLGIMHWGEKEHSEWLKRIGREAT